MHEYFSTLSGGCDDDVLGGGADPELDVGVGVEEEALLQVARANV